VTGDPGHSLPLAPGSPPAWGRSLRPSLAGHDRFHLPGHQPSPLVPRGRPPRTPPSHPVRRPLLLDFSLTQTPHFSPPCSLACMTHHVLWCHTASPAHQDTITALMVAPRSIVFSSQLLSHKCPTFLPTLSFLPRTHNVPCTMVPCRLSCLPGRQHRPHGSAPPDRLLPPTSLT
jgi:hypothetical protein